MLPKPEFSYTKQLDMDNISSTASNGRLIAHLRRGDTPRRRFFLIYTKATKEERDQIRAQWKIVKGNAGTFFYDPIDVVGSVEVKFAQEGFREERIAANSWRIQLFLDEELF